MASLPYTVSTAAGGRAALLEDMVVAPDARRAGIGAALPQHGVATARADACSRVTVLIVRVKEAAQRFYACHGFRLSAMIPMRLTLAPPESFPSIPHRE